MMASPRLFASFLQGGFEGSSHRRHDGQQLDMIAACRHDTFAEEDYALMRQSGLRTVRDALRWHLIERWPGRYDWSSFLPMLRAARASGVQVIWDVCHYGLPEDLDIWSGTFPERFAAFAGAAAAVVRDESDDVPFYSIMNEISFWAWAGGDRGRIYPHGVDRGPDLKRQLVRAAIAGTEAILAVDPRARFVHPEPIIHVTTHADGCAADIAAASAYHLAQYQAFDMLSGRLEPALGGREELLDIIGANFYWDNQWILGGETLGFGHPCYRPLSKMLAETHARYLRPILITETGAEGEAAGAWMRHVASEVRAALRQGLPILGICLYPVMDYPGWENERHCPCGLIEAADHWRHRRIRPEMLECLAREAYLCAATLTQLSDPDIRSQQR